jgi:hypothetical protein
MSNTQRSYGNLAAFLLLSFSACTQPAGRPIEPVSTVTKTGAILPPAAAEEAEAEVENPPPAPIAAQIPKRLSKAISGSVFLKRTAKISIMQREGKILDEFLNGNIPEFLTHLVPIRVAKKDAQGVDHRGWYWVTPDYLAIGSERDFVRMPMNPVTAQRIADRYGMLMVTPAMVDAIYRQAPFKLHPIPMKPGKQMRSNRYYAQHQKMIEAALKVADHGYLTAGHKKDVVITNRLANHPKRVAIYGWHENAWAPIQPLSIWHRKTYADYSHGVRLVYPEMLLDGKSLPVETVLRDPDLSSLLSDEGPLALTRMTLDGLEWDKDEMKPM